VDDILAEINRVTANHNEIVVVEIIPAEQ